MKKAILIVGVVGLALISNLCTADVIRGINIDFVNMGHAGNAGDTRTGIIAGLPIANPYGCGAVGYNYCIGKYEVTNIQWNTFTFIAGAPTGYDEGYSNGAYFTDAQQPTNYVSWYEAAQFCNYLTSGDKSKGAYQFSGDNSNPGNFLGINRATAQETYGTIYVLPTEDEWYKAAYYKPDGSGYSLYANGSNTAPTAGVQSNYNVAIGEHPWNVGAGTIEQNGTYDMMGNVCEWNETLIGDSHRGARGDSYYYGTALYNSSALRLDKNMDFDTGDLGFRIVSIPEPATLSLLGLGLLVFRRKINKI
jgi:hypothetical protein